MEKTDKRPFSELLRKLLSGYGWQPKGTELADKTDTYWELLRRYEWQDVLQACAAAPAANRFPEKAPTPGQLEGLVIACRRGRGRKLEEEPRAEQMSIAYNNAPRDPERQKAYIAAAPTKWERLVRSWECESKTLGLNPDRATPIGIFKIRMKNLNQLLDRVGNG